MHWHILGAGAIGCLWADFLTQAGQKVSLILRDQASLAQWPAGGRLEITEAEQPHHIHCQLETPDAEVPIRHLLVATKAYDTLSAVEAIQPRLHDDTEIVLLQNGMGQQEQLLERLGNVRLWAATTTAGAWLETRNKLHCVSRGDTHIGPLTDNTSALPSGWDRLDIPLHPGSDIQTHLWRKLAINCAINPLTALFDCRNGALLEDSGRIELMRNACREVEHVATAAGIELFPEPLEVRAAAVARATGENFSSMLQDIRHGRRSEIEQITGYLCQQADRLNIEVPVNHSLLQGIRALSPTGQR
ncbi:putative 2-dehydropantoate 2-reductase [Marinobacterium maritimum]|uniref:2-dehydropantoate 2-reductase n=1 Tax=Marinobacterium maritimum TaxID=500162 RepID=A0ABN1I5C8_9GAMM